jgi:hypothetical protein
MIVGILTISFVVPAASNRSTFYVPHTASESILWMRAIDWIFYTLQGYFGIS